MLITDRIEPGRWEGDLSSRQYRLVRSTTVPIADRLPGPTIMHLPADHAAAVRAALLEAFAQLPLPLQQTLTWDQGSEMAQHALIAPHFGAGMFFADPASP